MNWRTAHNHARRARGRKVYSVPVKRFAFRFPKRDGTSQRVAVTMLIFSDPSLSSDSIETEIASRKLEGQP